MVTKRGKLGVSNLDLLAKFLLLKSQTASDSSNRGQRLVIQMWDCLLLIIIFSENCTLQETWWKWILNIWSVIYTVLMEWSCAEVSGNLFLHFLISILRKRSICISFLNWGVWLKYFTLFWNSFPNSTKTEDQMVHTLQPYSFWVCVLKRN